MATTRTIEGTFTAGSRAGHVSSLLTLPPEPRFLYVLAHGAGAGMRHRFLETIAAELATRAVATFRYQFPYMESGKKRPDPPAVAEATVRRAVAAGRDALSAASGAGAADVPVVAGGKSFGGRMTSRAASDEGLEGVGGLVFLGFPLHAPGKPGTERAGHLAGIELPMLFLQGTRDSLADLSLLRPLVEAHAHATLHIVEGGDHSFGVRKKDGREAGEVMDELVGQIVYWAEESVLGS